MNAKQLGELLSELDACGTAREWANGKTFFVAWKTCERADWICWLLVKMAGKSGWPDKNLVRLALCDCAETALSIYEKYYPNDNRPRKAIEISRKYATGKATKKELAAAYAAAASAYAASAYAASAYAAAAYAAAHAASDALSAAHAAAHAAYAAASAAAYAASAAAYADRKKEALKTMSNLVRKRIGKFKALA